MHLNLVDDIHAVLAVDHIDSKSSSAKASCAANPVKVCLIVGIPFHVHREVKVDHQCHLFHIDSCNQQNHKWVYVQLQNTEDHVLKLTRLIDLTSGAHVCGHQHLLLAVPVAINDGSSLLHGQFPTQQCHLVALFGQV